MRIQELEGKKLALLLMAKTAKGEDDWAVFTGTICIKSGKVFVDRGTQGKPFEVREEWFDRIKAVASDMRELLLGADVYLPLSVGDKPDSESSFEDTGLHWPKSSESG